MVSVYRPGISQLVIPAWGVRINQMIDDYPWWLAGGILSADCKVAYQGKGAESLNASYINLNNPGTNNVTVVVAPTWNASTGWTFNGTTQILDTGVPPAANYSAIVRFANGLTPSGEPVYGYAKAGNTRFYIYPNSVGDAYYAYGGTQSPPVTPGLTSGVLGLAGAKAYRNGVGESPTFVAWSGTATNGLHFGGLRNENTSSYLYWSGDIIAFSYYSVALTAAQVLAVTNAMNLI